MRAFVYLVAARIRGFLAPGALDREFHQELETHLAMAEEDKVLKGLTPAEARREARIELGGLTQLREAGREARGLPWLETFLFGSQTGPSHAAQAMGFDPRWWTGDDRGDLDWVQT